MLTGDHGLRAAPRVSGDGERQDRKQRDAAPRGAGRVPRDGERQDRKRRDAEPRDAGRVSREGGRQGGKRRDAEPREAGGRREDERPVSITLSRGQVNQIVRAALDDSAHGGLPLLGRAPGLYEARVHRALSERYRSLQDNRRLSRSLLAGLLVLSCFAPGGQELGIKDISEKLALNSSTVHRYVATLLAAGLLERDPDTRRYRLASA